MAKQRSHLKIQQWVKSFTLWELLQGLTLTLRYFFKRKITVQYPEEGAAALSQW
jgi:formate hydrogenlyase subunit 6/NADH:ubiquinone oxidoreductase subunit I